MINKHKKQLSVSRDEVLYLTPETVFDSLKEKNPPHWRRLNAGTEEADLAKLLLVWRLISGRTQEQQAKLTGCPRPSYNLLESGKKGSNPGYLTLCRMAKSYGVSFKEFVAGPGNGTKFTS